jgi:hypothetical protein
MDFHQIPAQEVSIITETMEQKGALDPEIKSTMKIIKTRIT